MGTQRKRCTSQSRSEAARLVIDTGRPIAHVADETGIRAQLLGRWVAVERTTMGGGGVGVLVLGVVFTRSEDSIVQ